MAFGLKLPQGDSTLSKRKVPKTGPDENPATKKNTNLTTPQLPDRDGPARDAIDGGTPKRAPTAKTASSKPSKKTMKSMKDSLAGIGKF